MSAGVSDHHHRHHRRRHHHHLMDKENLFDFPTDFPYDFASHYSTESETNDEQLTQLTHRFFQSASLQQPLFNLKGKRVFTGSPESAPPLWSLKTDEDALNLIYAAAGQIARMKLTMSISNGAGEFVANNNNSGVIGVPHGFDGVGLLRRQQQLCRSRDVSAWSSPEVQNQCLRHRLFRSKYGVDGSRGGGDGGYTAAKREYAGTGVFLPRGYGDNPPESRKRQGGMIQSFTKSFIPITAPPELQAHINGGFVSHNALLMAQSKAIMLASQPLQQSPQRLRSNIHGLVTEAAVNNPAVLLPQEWTY